MEQVGTDDDELLGSWRRGGVDRLALFAAVRAPMRQGARRGIQSITARLADEHDVEDVVYHAFQELERHDPAEVHTAVGLAKRIAYRRGQDRGRQVVREREQMRRMLVGLADVEDQRIAHNDVLAAIEEEALIEQAMACMKCLTNEQRDLVQATIMEGENLSDWALRQGKSHQSASRQRSRAIGALRRCPGCKESSDGGGGGNE
jgi:DNA-directed RNA polymerase specialized sigma24 family protein